ncbi:MAG: RDD family protein [Verrucomicrobiae bacterium]|nr:RDD family protein [Verrucomicrobiae bacterium]
MNGIAASNQLWIKTPEGVTFGLPLASPLPRMVAWLLDALVIFALTLSLLKIFGLIGLLAPDLGHAMRILGWLGVSTGYGMALEWFWRGQTLGKKVLRLRVVDAQGLRLQFYQVFLRNVLRAVDALPLLYLLGGVVCMLSPRYQRLGDMAAGTVVIRTPQFTAPDLEQIRTGKFNSLRRYPHLLARLRQKTTPAEAALALQAVLRREAFTPEKRVELFHALAEHFSQKVAFPPEACEGLSDEQFIRNIVEALYRAEAKSESTTA